VDGEDVSATIFVGVPIAIETLAERVGDKDGCNCNLHAMLTSEESRATVRSWSDRKIRWYLRVAGRAWPGDHRVAIVRAERNRRRRLR
jgi:hypothetical protein